jgi:hypothetical protein
VCHNTDEAVGHWYLILFVLINVTRFRIWGFLTFPLQTEWLGIDMNNCNIAISCSSGAIFYCIIDSLLIYFPVRIQQSRHHLCVIELRRRSLPTQVVAIYQETTMTHRCLNTAGARSWPDGHWRSNSGREHLERVVGDRKHLRTPARRGWGWCAVGGKEVIILGGVFWIICSVNKFK